MPGPVLFQWSAAFQFEVWPVNTHEYDHLTQTDWAKKAIVGAAVYREWTGEGDEELHMRGNLFPYFFSMAVRGIDPGEQTIQILDNMRKAGHVDLLIRGDGRKMGWYGIDRMSRGHKMLGPHGVGRKIEFEVVFIRMPRPSPQSYLPSLWQFLMPSGGASDNVAPEMPGTDLNQ